MLENTELPQIKVKKPRRHRTKGKPGWDERFYIDGLTNHPYAHPYFRLFFDKEARRTPYSRYREIDYERFPRRVAVREAQRRFDDEKSPGFQTKLKIRKSPRAMTNTSLKMHTRTSRDNLDGLETRRTEKRRFNSSIDYYPEKTSSRA